MKAKFDYHIASFSLVFRLRIYSITASHCTPSSNTAHPVGARHATPGDS